MSTPSPEVRLPGAWQIVPLLTALAFAMAVAAGVLYSALGEAAPPSSTLTVQPIESYDSADLRRAAAALEALAETRLTPDERVAVENTAEVLDQLADGDAVIAATPTTTTSTSSTTTPPPPSTVRQRTADEWADLLARPGGGVPLVTSPPTTEP